MQADHPSRMPSIDALKAICCLLIVAHHLAIYGPMSDLAYPLIPALMEWLREYGRIAVQMFFVIAGFLSAANSHRKAYLGRTSYSIFLVHFPISLVINAAFFNFLPHQPVIHLFGLLSAICTSIGGGILLFR